jgi:hypothetical protein
MNVTLPYITTTTKVDTIRMPSLKPLIDWLSAPRPTDEEIPTRALLRSLEKSETEVKAGKVISFSTGKDALDYLDAIIDNDKQKK